MPTWTEIPSTAGRLVDHEPDRGVDLVRAGRGGRPPGRRRAPAARSAEAAAPDHPARAARVRRRTSGAAVSTPIGQAEGQQGEPGRQVDGAVVGRRQAGGDRDPGPPERPFEVVRTRPRVPCGRSAGRRWQGRSAGGRRQPAAPARPRTPACRSTAPCRRPSIGWRRAGRARPGQRPDRCGAFTVSVAPSRPTTGSTTERWSPSMRWVSVVLRIRTTEPVACTASASVAEPEGQREGGAGVDAPGGVDRTSVGRRGTGTAASRPRTTDRGSRAGSAPAA